MFSLQNGTQQKHQLTKTGQGIYSKNAYWASNVSEALCQVLDVQQHNRRALKTRPSWNLPPGEWCLTPHPIHRWMGFHPLPKASDSLLWDSEEVEGVCFSGSNTTLLSTLSSPLTWTKQEVTLELRFIVAVILVASEQKGMTILSTIEKEVVRSDLTKVACK